jgi:DNA-binding XRE family transcriptional regulator
MPPTGPLATLQALPMEERAVAFALSVLVERIASLPRTDRDDLFELMQSLRKQNSREELAEILKTMEEILAQTPPNLIDAVPADSGTEGLQRWKNFVAKNIRALRIKAGFTQTQLAERAGLPQSHISRLENAQYSATNMTLQKIADALGVPVSRFDPSD